MDDCVLQAAQKTHSFEYSSFAPRAVERKLSSDGGSAVSRRGFAGEEGAQPIANPYGFEHFKEPR